MKNLTGVPFQQFCLLDPVRPGLDFALYQAVEATTGRERLVEVLFPGREPGSDFTQGFQELAGQLERLRHPALPTLLASGSTGLGCFLAFDLDPQEWAPLSAGGMDPGAAAALCARVASALDCLHEHDLAHGSLSPSSLLSGPGGEGVSVLNAGLAALMNRELARIAPQGMVGFGVGEPAALAPEQVLGRAPAPAADLYALGMLYAALVAGELPGRGHTPADTALGRLTRPQAWLPGLPRPALAFLRRCTAFAPSGRFASAAQAQVALERLARRKGARPVGAGGER